MAEIAVAVASEVTKCLVAPVGRHCGYVIFCDRRVCELNAEIEKLVGTKDDVQSSIDEAQNDMKPIIPRVEEWVKHAEASATKAHNMLENDERAKKTCFYGWLPNPKARYRLGNEASKMIKEIKDLIEQGQFKRVHDKISPPGRVDSTPVVNLSAGDGGNTIFKSQASTFQDVMNALYDEKHKVIGVYGPGGVGKTTLLEIVEVKLKKEGKPFRMIVKSKVSQNPDLTKIQYDIAYALGLKDLKNEPSEEGRRHLLFKRLQRDPSEKVLIILDDLWAELDLKAVGIPLGNESMKCKLLLTSRDKRVLEERMNADQTFPLKSLEEEEALKLFEKIVDDRLRDNEELKAKAAQVVTKLAGLPLLITSVATILKRRNVSTWESMLIKIEDPNIERIVRWSYDHVESEDAKCLFLLCGLIGGTIEVELLLGLGMGLGLFEGYNERVQHSRNRLNEMLDSLHSFCLLQDGGDDKKNVTIHDLYSEVVVSTPFRGQNSLMMNNNYGPRSKEKLEKCWAICLADVDKDRLDKLMTCQFTDLEILMLSNQDWADCRMDFTYMKELRVLYFSSIYIDSLPPSIEILGNLHSLYLDNCDVEDVTILGKLKALQILSCAGTAISRLPKEIGELTNLRLLNLRGCYDLETIKTGVLDCLTNLEELYLDDCKVEDVAILGKLIALRILSCERSLISRLPIEIGELTNLRSLNLRECYDLETIETGVLECLTNLEELYLDDCPMEDVAILGKLKALRILSCERSLISRLPIEIGELTNLRSLNLRECCNLKTIETGVLERLTNLEELYICSRFHIWTGKDQISSESCNARLAELKSLTKLVALETGIHDPTLLLEDGDLPFGNLNRFRISVGRFQQFLVNYSTNMQLNLEGCDSILSKEWVQKALQKTQNLHLCGLSEFKKSAHELCTQGFKEVEYLRIEDSPSINYIANSSDGLPLTAFRMLESLTLQNLIKLEKICNGLVTPESFSKLRYIMVKRCDQLKSFWSLSDWQRLGQLEVINVQKCDSMQSIVTLDAREGIVSIDNRVELPNLFRLVLCKLPNMTSFCTRAEITSEDTPIQVSLPRLKFLVIDGLLGLEKILYSELSLKYSSLISLLIRASKSTSKSILKLDWILKLSNLESMSLGSFPLAEVVFDLEGLKVIGDVEICSRLTKLTLEQLPNLQCMWKQDVKLQGISIFRNLRDLFVYKTGLSFLFSVSVAKCFKEIRVIRMWDCRNMKAVIVDEEGRNEGTYEFPLLEHLSIRQCPMEKFFTYPHGNTSDSQDAHSDSFFDQKVAFPTITSLFIEGLRCKELCNNQIPPNSFKKLEYLELKNCDNLQRIATSCMWKKHCPKELQVISCRSIKIIYEGDGTDIEIGKLRRLVLCNLENLRCIWQSDSLTNIPFPNLSVVEAMWCPRLEMVFPTFTAKFLGQIEELMVNSCEDMEVIAGHEKGKEATRTTITFSKLTLLILVKLPKFRRFFLPEKYSLKFPCSEDFPSLRGLTIESCGAKPRQVLGNGRHRQCLQESCMLSERDQVIGQRDFDRTERERGMLFVET